MKVLTKWASNGEPEVDVATNDQIEKTSSVAIVDLSELEVNLPEMLESVNALMIQGNQESGNPFNITAVTFTNYDVSSAIDNVLDFNVTPAAVYNLQGIKVLDNGSELSNLPAGIYISNGKKYIVK